MLEISMLKHPSLIVLNLPYPVVKVANAKIPVKTISRAKFDRSSHLFGLRIKRTEIWDQ